jgi:hypothetical protein
MSMQGMADDISILNDGVRILAWLAIDDNLPSLDGSAIVFPRSVTEL